MAKVSDGGAPLYKDENMAIKVLKNLMGQLTGYPPADGFVRPMAKAKTGMVRDGEVCGRLSSNPNGLRPIIFSHGWMGQPEAYIGFAKDLASHGFLVLMPRHQDGSCAHTTTQEGKELWFKAESHYEEGIRQKRRGQVDIRVKEVLSIVDELRFMHPTFREKLFGEGQFDVKVDLSQLVLAGHSFGGVTAVVAAAKLPEHVKIKAVQVFDNF